MLQWVTYQWSFTSNKNTCNTSDKRAAINNNLNVCGLKYFVLRKQELTLFRINLQTQ